jgi:hypothetical protein
MSRSAMRSACISAWGADGERWQQQHELVAAETGQTIPWRTSRLRRLATSLSSQSPVA